MNKILIYLILGLLAIIIVVGIIIFLVNRNNNNNNTKITKSENTPPSPQPAVPSNDLPEMVSSAYVSCPSNKYYDYDTNQCTNLKSSNSTCKNGVACASGVCLLPDKNKLKTVTSGPKTVLGNDAHIANAAECNAAATALNKTWGGSVETNVVSGCYLMNMPAATSFHNKVFFNRRNTNEPCSNNYQCIQKEIDGKCSGDQLSKNCIEMDLTDTNKCKTCYNLTLNDKGQCCPEHCIDCDRDGNCKDGKCKSGYYLDNNKCKSGKSRSVLGSENTTLTNNQNDLETQKANLQSQYES